MDAVLLFSRCSGCLPSPRTATPFYAPSVWGRR